MKTEVRTLTPSGNSATVPCRAGELIRILSVNGGVSGTATGDQILVTLFRAGIIIAFIPLPTLTVTTTAFCAAIGLSPIGPLLLSLDPVTGATGYSQCPTVSAALPDLASDDHDIDVTVSTVSGTTIATNAVVYEVTR